MNNAQMLSVVIPVCNEESHIHQYLPVIASTFVSLFPSCEIIVVNDGSKDGTAAAVRSIMQKYPCIQLHEIYPHSGTGNAFRRGTELSNGDYVAFCNATLEVHPRQFSRFMEIMQQTGCGAVVGSKLHPDSHGNCPKHRRVISYGYYALLQILFGLNVKDAQTGIKLFRAEIIKPAMRKMLVKTHAFDVELLAVLHREGQEIVSAPIEYQFIADGFQQRVPLHDIFNVLHDTLAVFYRLKILKFYDRSNVTDHTICPKNLCFFIGTEAEFIKLFPIMLKLEEHGIDFYIIASGQNDIRKSTIFHALSHKAPDILLHDPDKIKKSVLSVFGFFFAALHEGKRILPQALPAELLHDGCLIVHGDTISTVLGAILGNHLHMTVAHVEAGLRSYNLLDPFPEEIDRMITSRYARIHFAPGIDAERNLWNVKGAVINTEGNTLIDALSASMAYPSQNAQVLSLTGRNVPYFIQVVHRQENLMNRAVVTRIVSEVIAAAEHMHCVFVMHETTQEALIRYSLLQRLEACEQIELIPRTAYFDFMKLIGHAEFIITDGGSNQEELYYLGKPCLLLRRHTERTDGLETNVIMFEGDYSKIGWFIRNYQQYQRPAVTMPNSPSAQIASILCGDTYNSKFCAETYEEDMAI